MDKDNVLTIFPVHIIAPRMVAQNVQESLQYIDGFQSIFSLWQLEGKGSCDVDIDQSAGSMVM